MAEATREIPSVIYGEAPPGPGRWRRRGRRARHRAGLHWRERLRYQMRRANGATREMLRESMADLPEELRREIERARMQRQAG